MNVALTMEDVIKFVMMLMALSCVLVTLDLC